MAATAMAIEAAICQNFLWHRRWTWADRQVQGIAAACLGLLRFNLTNGLVSLGGYLMSAWIFTGFWGVDPLLANALGLIPCGIANFFLADWLVFPTGV